MFNFLMVRADRIMINSMSTFPYIMVTVEREHIHENVIDKSVSNLIIFFLSYCVTCIIVFQKVYDHDFR